MQCSHLDHDHAPRRPSVQSSRADPYINLGFLVACRPAGALIGGMTRIRSIFTIESRIAAASAAALLVLPACSGSKAKSEPTVSTSSSLSPSSETTTTTARTTPSTTTTDPSKPLVASVRAFWDLYLQVGARTGPFNAAETRSQLGQRTTGQELTKLYDVFQGNAVAGAIVKGTIDIAPTVESITGTTAQVSDCYDDKTGLYRVSDGSRIDTDDPRRHKVLMTLTRVGAAWKVSAIRDEGLGCTV